MSVTRWRCGPGNRFSRALNCPVRTSTSGSRSSITPARRNTPGRTPFGTRSGTAESTASSSFWNFRDWPATLLAKLSPPLAAAGRIVPALYPSDHPSANSAKYYSPLSKGFRSACCSRICWAIIAGELPHPTARLTARA